MRIKKTFPIYLVILGMRMIDAAGPMVSLTKETFKISIAMATLLPQLGCII
jgi:hypothetical protein